MNHFKKLRHCGSNPWLGKAIEEIVKTAQLHQT